MPIRLPGNSAPVGMTVPLGTANTVLLEQQMAQFARVNGGVALSLIYEGMLRYIAAGQSAVAQVVSKWRQYAADDSFLAKATQFKNGLSQAQYDDVFRQLDLFKWVDGNLHSLSSIYGEKVIQDSVPKDLFPVLWKANDSAFRYGMLQGYARAAAGAHYDPRAFVSATDYNYIYAQSIGLMVPQGPNQIGLMDGLFGINGKKDPGDLGLMGASYDGTFFNNWISKEANIPAPRTRWRVVKPTDKPLRAVCIVYGDTFRGTNLSLFCDFARYREFGANVAQFIQNCPDGAGLPEGETVA